MRKYVKIISGAAALALCVLAAGCSGGSGGPGQAGGPPAQVSENAPEAAQSRALYGEIAEVIGNAVVVKEMEMPERPERREGGEERPEGGGLRIRGEGTGEAPGPGGRREIERAYTGTEQEVIIPVGTPITTFTRGENGPEEKELSLTDVKAGDVITITYAGEGESEAIQRVFVSQGGMMMVGGGPGGGREGNFFFSDGGGGGERTLTIINEP